MVLRAKAACVVCAIALGSSSARAGDEGASVERSTAEFALGAAAGGAYAGATLLWLTSLATEAPLEQRLVPALALGAGAAWALHAYDRRHPFTRGTLASVTSGATVGLGIGLAWVLHNRAGASPWSNDTSNTMLWLGATAGAGIGAFAARGAPTPGRAAFTSAAALWTATATGLLVASVGRLETAPRRGYLGAALSMEVGVIAAGWLGRRTTPSVTRVALAASLALASGLAVGAATWGLSGTPELSRAQTAWGAAALGMLGGGVGGWVWPL